MRIPKTQPSHVCRYLPPFRGARLRASTPPTIAAFAGGIRFCPQTKRIVRVLSRTYQLSNRGQKVISLKIPLVMGFFATLFTTTLGIPHPLNTGFTFAFYAFLLRLSTFLFLRAIPHVFRVQTAFRNIPVFQEANEKFAHDPFMVWMQLGYEIIDSLSFPELKAQGKDMDLETLVKDGERYIRAVLSQHANPEDRERLAARFHQVLPPLIEISY